MTSSMDLSDKCIDPGLKACCPWEGLDCKGVWNELFAVIDDVIVILCILLEYLLQLLFIPFLKLLVVFKCRFLSRR